jgi:DNA polymerase-1
MPAAVRRAPLGQRNGARGFAVPTGSDVLHCVRSCGFPRSPRTAPPHPLRRGAGVEGVALPGDAPTVWGLTDALRYRKLIHAMQDEKPGMIALILSKDTFSDDEKANILAYCASDVIALEHLLPEILPTLDLPRAIGFRGRYMKAVATMETMGSPFDTATYERIKAALPSVEADLIKRGDAATGVYRDDGRFSFQLFEDFLIREGLEWDRTDRGRPALDADYVKRRAAGFPKLRDFHELRGTLSLLRGLDKDQQPDVSDGSVRKSNILTPSADGFIRCSLWAFGSATGRNQPAASQFIFGPATWLRGLIKPPPGYGVAYIDWSQQEFALAGGLSGDQNMIAAYESGDVYMAFAIAAGLAPVGADKQNPQHGAVRDACKSVVLGMSYGKGYASIAVDANLPVALAKMLYDSHKRTYAVFWRWIDHVITTATLRDRFIQTRWGWRQLCVPDTKTLSLLNFPMQAHGATMMQMAAIMATERGLGVCCPVHDAFLIMSPLDTLDADVRAMQQIMAQAARLVAKVDIRSDAHVVRFRSKPVPVAVFDQEGKLSLPRQAGIAKLSRNILCIIRTNLDFHRDPRFFARCETAFVYCRDGKCNGRRPSLELSERRQHYQSRPPVWRLGKCLLEA